MSRPSEPLLRWLRAQLDARGENTASLASTLGRPRGEVRKILTGAEAMTVDDLLAISEALDLSPEDMGVPAVDEEALDVPEASDGGQWGNQPEALFRLGFDLGMDFLFTLEVSELDPETWGGPDAVLEQYAGKGLPLKLDAAYHQHMDPEFSEEGITITLSFDTLYRCTLPWHAIQQVVFWPMPPEPPEEDEDDGGDAGPPFLRLVT